MEGLLALPDDLPAGLRDVLTSLHGLEPSDFPRDTRVVFLIPRDEVVSGLKGATRHRGLPGQEGQQLDSITAVHDAANNGVSMHKHNLALAFTFSAIDDDIILHSNSGPLLSMQYFCSDHVHPRDLSQQRHYILTTGIYVIREGGIREEEDHPDKWVAFKVLERSFEVEINMKLSRIGDSDWQYLLDTRADDELEDPVPWEWKAPGPGTVLDIKRRDDRTLEYRLTNMATEDATEGEDKANVSTLTFASKHTRDRLVTMAVTKLSEPIRSGHIRAQWLETWCTSMHMSAKRHAAEVRNNRHIQGILPSCPNIARFIMADSRLHAVTMGYNPGARDLTSLQDAATPGAIPLPEQLRITLGALTGLQWLHTQAGLLHLDIRPQNILVSPRGVVFLAGFAHSAKLAPRRDGGDDDDDVSLEDQSTFGTLPAYMPPEVLEGKKLGCPGDIWSLGVTMLALSSQHHLFPPRPRLDLNSSPIRGRCWIDDRDLEAWGLAVEECSKHTVLVGRWATAQARSYQERDPGPNETMAEKDAAAALYRAMARMVEHDEGERITVDAAIQMLRPHV